MSTVAIDSTHPSSTLNVSVLNASLDKMIDCARRNQPYIFSPDDFVLLWNIRYCATDGKTATGTPTAVTMTY